jgi:hypothetical protein
MNLTNGWESSHVSVAQSSDAHGMGPMMMMMMMMIHQLCLRLSVKQYSECADHEEKLEHSLLQVVFLLATWGSLAGAALVFGSIMWFAWSKHLLLIPDTSSMARDIS